MKRPAWMPCLLLLAAGIGYSQQVGEQPAGLEQSRSARDRAAEAQERLQLAVSSLDYPVTPGDVYRLTYRQTSDSLVSREILVDADSTVDLGIFGKIGASGLSFVELKARVEELIANSYTRSLPYLSILSPGIFRVSVKGEITAVQHVTAWGLTKLSEVIEDTRGPYSSLRNIEILSCDGETGSYDLLKAMRLGASDQDPHVRPEDTIILFPARRTIRLSGEVRPPGDYELVQGEGLRDLVEVFGGGLTGRAEPTRLRVDRMVGGTPRSEYVALPQAYLSDMRLQDGDAVIVSSKADRQGVVWFEGAVSVPQARPGDGTADQERGAAVQGRAEAFAAAQQRPYTRFSSPIREGEMLSDAINTIRDSILPIADLSSALLFRAGEEKPLGIDLHPLLADSNPASDIPLRANDTVFIPSLRSTVSVAGAVIAPGFFPYQPGYPASYYLSLAGGVDPERNWTGRFWVADQQGKRRRAKDPIMPGDRVYAPVNSWGYRLERQAPVYATIVIAVVNIISLYNTWYR